MRLAIADPPYLGRAALWYGGKGRRKQGTAGRACGRGQLDAEYHPDAGRWDEVARAVLEATAEVSHGDLSEDTETTRTIFKEAAK